MDRETIIKELHKGAASWNKWRKHSVVGDLVLDNIELQDMDLDRVDLSRVSLKKATITGCSLKRADFISANLEGADLRNNDFSEAKLIAARLDNADLSASILCKTNLLTASTGKVRLENIDFKGHDISGLNLKNTSLAGSNLEGQNLSRMDLSCANLAGSNLKDADLTDALLTGANVASANLHNAKLRGAVFKSADMRGVDLSKLDLQDTDFSSCNLSGCDLREANLSQSKLVLANLTGAKLWNLHAKDWQICNIICSYAYWDKQAREKTSYRPREFERLFAEPVTIKLHYPDRLTSNELATLPIFIEHLGAVHWGIILRLKSVEEVAGGSRVQFVVEDHGTHSPSDLKHSLQAEANCIQLAQLSLRMNPRLNLQLREKILSIREEFWPRLLELAADHEKDQVRNLTVMFMDLKGFSQWKDGEVSEKLSLFRGLVKPILHKWQADYPNMEGDSLRVTFKNTTDALFCACMIRGVLREAGFDLRIGIEMGEVAVVHNVVTELSDLEGSAISMAARMEAAAESGEILISHKVLHHTEYKDGFRFIPRQVKLKKSIGDKQAGDKLSCYAVESIKTA